jgi:SAM-dependent methyltransferase
MSDKLKKFWESCDVGYAHLTPDRNLLDPKNENYKNKLHKLFIDHIEWKDKTVLDYGIGGGYLGRYLFEKMQIKKYVGIDIAQRSLDFANMTLKDYKIRLYLAPKDYSQFDIDIFLSVACIQHFPDEKYLIKFLKDINNSKVKKICLIFKYADPIAFKNTYLKNTTNAGTFVNKNYMLKQLTNFKMSDTIANNNRMVLICDNINTI